MPGLTGRLLLLLRSFCYLPELQSNTTKGYEHTAVNSLFYGHLLCPHTALYPIEFAVVGYSEIIPQSPHRPDAQDLVEV
jgi:hypothetical protein